ncbi:MAG: hypothetical protein ACJ74N_00065 [Gaiellaceae bacterium]
MRARGTRLACVASAFALALAVGGGVAAADSPARLEAPWPAATGSLRFVGDADARPVRRALAGAEWWGGAYTAGTGETVRILVSTAYPRDDAVARGWADFFAGLRHGDELARATVYLAPLAEVAAVCGGDALGCYASDELVVVGNSTDGVTPQEVAAHEYGHHLARNRLNPPWLAVDRGTKRWSSGVSVCSRVASGEFLSGDEGDGYSHNPAEGFAEAYRVFNEARAGATTFSWPIVDPAFYPDAGAFAAIDADVTHPWAAPATRAVTARFTRRGPRVVVIPLAATLDGELSATIRLTGGSTHELELLDAKRHTVLARGLWAGVARKTLGFLVCGQRDLALRVVRRGPPGPVRIVVRTP